ncbi:protein NDR1-like [Salvia hispanica]|uniref:protein NDR1-like n=1 Tax=Salvia hispanica TaxID=49212 RepID=UPI0020090F45|nr:protein NDR1-like [Salvia hispanica]
MAEASDQSKPLPVENDDGNPSTVESETQPMDVVIETTSSSSDTSLLTTIALIGAALTTLGAFAAFLIQQSFHLPGPHCSIQQLYVPALDTSAPPQNTTNPFLFFVLDLENNLQIRSISYGAVTLTFYYGRKAVGSYVVPGFYQGRNRAARRRDVVETRGVPWEDAARAVAGGGTAGFRVELAARPRFKILLWYSKEKKVRVVAEVAVDGSGLKAGRDDVVMHRVEDSGAMESGVRVMLLFFYVLLLHCFIH